MQKVCPIDGVPLMEMNKNGVTIDVCPECKGVWLDRGELEKLIQVALEMEREYGDAPRRDARDDPRRDGGFDQRRVERGYDPRRDERGYDPRGSDPRYPQQAPQYGQPYRRDDDDDDYRYGKKKKSTLGRIFDIFD
jgi:uncharacterized protein